MATNAQPTDESTGTPPGFYLGTDGAGLEHYYQTGTRRVTVVGDDGQRSYKIGDDQDLIDWAIATVKEHEKFWEGINVDPLKEQWLTGEVPVGEGAIPESEIDDE